MLYLCAVDTGRSGTKTFTEGVRDYFPSILGEYRELRLEREMGLTDMVVEHEGEKYFIGAIAEESISGAQMMLNSKVHNDTKLFILSALHRVLPNNAQVFLVVGEPIANHTSQEKARIKDLLSGTHRITINHEEKSFQIVRVEVAAECATPGWAMRKSGKFHVIDVGSRTVNYATMNGRRWIDKLSGSLDYGIETVQDLSMPLFARKVIADLTKRLNTLFPLILIGGKANELIEHFKQYTTDISVHEDPLYANATAFYRLGNEVLETTKAQ
ncbi:ParM/StbA family protein [Alicyclobacillus fodiniaquatilis]|uniref:ParM/StbA family protein n=1 Tax=Alicyclobacillus fodiniaquatilis TaxID=1661150 RepID=A0ABW4JIE2_9BACL